MRRGRDREAAWPTRLARLPVVGEIGIHFKPERWVRRKLTEAYADPAMVTAERVKRTAELQRFPGNREATLQRARTQEPLDPAPLRRLTVATLILWGAKDRWVPVADAFRFQNDIKAAKLEVFEKLGHDPMEEDPKATAAAVAAFLKPIAVRSAPIPPRCRSTGMANGRGIGEVPLVARPIIETHSSKIRRSLNCRTDLFPGPPAQGIP